MPSQEHVITDYFHQVGLSQDMAKVYLALHAHGTQTMAELTQSSDVPRIRIYRLLPKLAEANLIETELRHKRTVFSAAPIDNLRLLVLKREHQLEALKEQLPIVEAALSQQSLSSPATRVNFYRGREGIRQMLWTQLKATNEIVCYNQFAFEDLVGLPFIANWGEEFERRNLRCRLIYGDEFRATWKLGSRIKGMEYYYLAPSIFRITHACDIYDDVTAYYHWRDGEIFGLEIHNKEIADSQRQLFEILFERSTPETLF